MSRKVVRKLYHDFEKEERWLNGMAAEGLSLVDYSWGRYTFEETSPGAWIYRLELLPENPDKPAGREYLDFMAEAGVETVATYMRWAYFRKPAAAGPFELFSDLDSRISHYQRVSGLYGLLTALLGGVGSLGMSRLVDLAESNIGSGFGLPIFALWVILVAMFFVQTLRLFSRVRRLKEQRRLSE